jgi:uncharacterized protein YjiK
LADRLIAVLAGAVLCAGAAAAEGALRHLGSVRIADRDARFAEPSGLAVAADGRGFRSVSDDAPRIVALGQDGALAPARALETDVTDLEGVAEDPARGRLLAVAEDAATIVIVDLAGGAVELAPLAGLEGYEAIAAVFRDGDPNDGLEGIAVHPETGSVFVVKERGPRLLLELTPDLLRIRGALELSAEIGFVDDETVDDRLDVSGLAVDMRRGGLWIVSDTGGSAFLLDLETLTARGWPLLRSDKRGAKRIRNAEGVALSADGAVLHVVTDDGKKSRLHRYAIEID